MAPGARRPVAASPPGTVNLASAKRDRAPSKVIGPNSAGTRHLSPHAEGAISEHSVIGRAHEMPPNSEQVLDEPVYREESLRLTGRFEPAHLSLSLSRRLMRDLGPVVRVLARVEDHPRHRVPSRRAVAPQLVGDQPPWFARLAIQQPSEEALCGTPVTPAPLRRHRGSRTGSSLFGTRRSATSDGRENRRRRALEGPISRARRRSTNG